jgi:hypothetical protein
MMKGPRWIRPSNYAHRSGPDRAAHSGGGGPGPAWAGTSAQAGCPAADAPTTDPGFDAHECAHDVVFHSYLIHLCTMTYYTSRSRPHHSLLRPPPSASAVSTSTASASASAAYSALMASDSFSASMRTVRWMLPLTVKGRREASTTRRFSKPCTAPFCGDDDKTQGTA